MMDGPEKVDLENELVGREVELKAGPFYSELRNHGWSTEQDLQMYESFGWKIRLRRSCGKDQSFGCSRSEKSRSLPEYNRAGQQSSRIWRSDWNSQQLELPGCIRAGNDPIDHLVERAVLYGLEPCPAQPERGWACCSGKCPCAQRRRVSDG